MRLHIFLDCDAFIHNNSQVFDALRQAIGERVTKSYEMRNVVILFTLFLLFGPVANGQSSRLQEIRRIDNYVKQLNAYTKRYKKPHLIFADTSQTDKPKWKRFASEEALNKVVTYNIAFVWRKNGRIVKANFTLFSESGDWAQYVYHYFRADGSLAKLESELRTFYGDMIVIKNFYYDSKGSLLRKRTRYFDLRSKKPIKPREEANELVFDFDTYKSVRRLPFINLLRN